jgi:hypothetical protein
MWTSPDRGQGQGAVRVVVLAAPDDAAAQAYAGRLDGAVLVVPGDLSRRGWTYVPDPTGRTGAAGDATFGADQLVAVVTRLTVVLPDHLPHVAAKHRDYVAAEQTAFLRAWLAGLTCRVVNPPTSTCLFGPLLTPHEWVRVCGRLAVPARPARSDVPAEGPPHRPVAGPRVSVWCDHAVPDGPCSPALLTRAVRLASALRVSWLGVTFAGTEPHAEVALVDSFPDVADPVFAEGLATLTPREAPA